MFMGVLTYFGCETKTGVVRTFIVFQKRSMDSNVIQRVSARAFMAEIGLSRKLN